MTPATSHHEALIVLMGRAQAGDADAVEAVLARLRPPLVRYLVGRFTFRWNTEAAEDVAQDTLMRIAARLDHYRGTTDGELYAWAFAIARNCALASLREAPAGSLTLGQGVSLGALRHVRTMAIDLWSSPDSDQEGTSSAEGTRMCQLVVQAYDALPEDAALLIWHRVIEGLAWAEIAAEHATTPTAAKRRFQRMQQAIRRHVLTRIAGCATEDAARLLGWIQSR